MSYLRFEKAVMTNLEESLRRELLRTNRSGACRLQYAKVPRTAGGPCA